MRGPYPIPAQEALSRELVEAFLVHVREGEGASDREDALLEDVLEQRVRAEALA